MKVEQEEEADHLHLLMGEVLHTVWLLEDLMAIQGGDTDIRDIRDIVDR